MRFVGQQQDLCHMVVLHGGRTHWYIVPYFRKKWSTKSVLDGGRRAHGAKVSGNPDCQTSNSTFNRFHLLSKAWWETPIGDDVSASESGPTVRFSPAAMKLLSLAKSQMSTLLNISSLIGF
jgi:hypothetical protein